VKKAASSIAWPPGTRLDREGMMRWRSVAVTILLLPVLTAGLLSPASSGGPIRYSGTVIAMDQTEGVLVIDEIGPWSVQQGRTAITRRTITLTPSTRFNVFIRVNVPGGWTNDFLEVELEAGDIAPGDFVTAECVLERGRLVARSVTLAETVEPN
jgi:hypothetical protein